MTTTDLHAVLAVLENGTKIRLSEYATYDEALAAHAKLDAWARKGRTLLVRLPGVTTGTRNWPIKHLAVRSAADPGWNTAQVSYAPITVLSRAYKDQKYAAKLALTTLGNGERGRQGWVTAARDAGFPVFRIRDGGGWHFVEQTIYRTETTEA